MIAVLGDKTLSIIRNRRGVVWCPYCDTSMQWDSLNSDSPSCVTCHAEFKEDPVVAVVAAVATVAEVADVTDVTDSTEQPANRKVRNRAS